MADVSKVNVNSTDYNIKDSNAMHKGVDRVTAGQSIIAPIGTASTADGFAVNASGDYSHASGFHTIAASDVQHVIGKYNEEDANGTYPFIIGGGRLDTDRKNIFTVDWNGDVNAGRSNGLTNDTKLPTGADVISYLNSNFVVGKGTYSLGGYVCSGYTTGSGNYFDFFVPMLIDPSVTTIALNSTSASDFTFSIYGKSSNYAKSDFNFTSTTIDKYAKGGLKIELKFTSTKSPNELGIIAFTSFTLKLS